MRFPEDVPVLTDGVVTLRAHHEGDLPALLEQAIDPVSVEWTTVPVPSSLETSRDYALKILPTNWEQDSGWAFAVEAADEAGQARFAGTVELRPEGERRAEIAYGAHPWARGRGVMERACRLLLDWGFRERRLETVIWWANRGNFASRRLAWRLGFSCDGTVRQWLPQRGTLRDAWVGALTSRQERSPQHPWWPVPRVVGRDVVLRPFDRSDVTRIVQACNDEQTSYWLSRMPAPYSREDAEEYVLGRAEGAASGDAVTWAVADPATDGLLGNISLFGVSRGHEAELGYWTHPAGRGRGLTKQAAALAVRHAFVPEEDGGLGLRRVSVFAAEGNLASRRVIESVGFTETGRDRLGIRLRDGSLVDSIGYDLLATEWAERNAG
ncbi:GNAT family N-acetyltransferase [Nocardioides mesophilus]|uniref:GNAT family N-acetyltransferase n=1 Tax=Nocardioides mesophilus TaxID=433659 RepID=A0A7G9RDQ3_9ACTN|nr:GNAT family N-acetyltransferase [Nocardioides mesophilus]QNN53728.1 GNAT family N-acetyltransferase [Nocardioides mesophilus]